MAMISTQSICRSSPGLPLWGACRKSRVSFPVCKCPPRIPQQGASRKSPVSLSSSRRQPGGHLKWSSGFLQNGRGHGTVTVRQASPDHSDGGEVPVENTPECHSTGTKIEELVDPISPTKLIDDQLPSLLTMIIDGFPPIKISKYVDEAENCLPQYIQRYQNAIFLDSYYRTGLSAAAYGHPQVISVDRIIAIAINFGLLFLLDDIFFDTPSEILDNQYGIPHDAHRNPQSIQEYLDHLDAIFSQQVQPNNPASLIETIVWETGQYTLGLTNPEWFNHYVAVVVEHHHASVASHVDIVQGHNSCFQDVESYAVMRVGNVGGKFIQMMIELANDSYIPSILRADPYFEKLTTATSIHIGFVNDIFSYHKESLLEQNPRNLITVLMECEGKPFVQTMHMAIEVVNSYGSVIMDLEAEAWNSTFQNYMQSIKEVIAGNVYYGSIDHRYRQANSIFPELRDTTSSWKIPIG